MRIRKIKQVIPNMSKVIGANDTPSDKDVYSSLDVKNMIDDTSNKITLVKKYSIRKTFSSTIQQAFDFTSLITNDNIKIANIISAIPTITHVSKSGDWNGNIRIDLTDEVVKVYIRSDLNSEQTYEVSLTVFYRIEENNS